MIYVPPPRAPSAREIAVSAVVGTAKLAALAACVVLALAWFSVVSPADAAVDTEPAVLWPLRLAVVVAAAAFVVVVVAAVVRQHVPRQRNPFGIVERDD